MSNSSTKSDSWGSRVGLILAMAGNAVGLGNFLRFPVQAVQNGGGVFIIPYIICFILMGVPLLWIEWATGRFGGKGGNHSTPFILDTMAKRKFWKYFGVFGIFTNIAVASYYCYIESWTLSYVFHSVFGTFTGMTQAEVAAFFGTYVDIGTSTSFIPMDSVVVYVFCLVVNTYILSKGLSGGVEKVAKIGMPMLIFFGVILAIRAFTLGDSGAPDGCTDCNAFTGLNFLWEPHFDSITNPKVWMAAAGQIFFTLSVGMGTIQCYASYVRANDDIALNAVTAGFMNGFVEIVLGASIVIPISVGYLGLDWVLDNAGFSMAFQTMPYLFSQWGSFLGAFAGLMWFGLLFFAGITSSLAMGTPWMGFMRDEFKWTESKSAISFGVLVFIVGMPTVIFFNEGVFDQYDYWAGTISLVVFAMAETIIFAWIFGITNGWNEINAGADIKVPIFFKYIIKYVTPTFILIVFLGAMFTPKGNDWGKALSGDWELDASSIIGQIQNKNVVANRHYFADVYQSEVDGIVDSVDGKKVNIAQNKQFYKNEKGKLKLYRGATDVDKNSLIDSVVVVKTYSFDEDMSIIVKKGDNLKIKDTIANGSVINNIFYTDLARLLLILLFAFICFVVHRATILRNSNKLS